MLRDRFLIRGDDVQTLDSLTALASSYEEWAQQLEGDPCATIIRSGDPQPADVLSGLSWRDACDISALYRAVLGVVTSLGGVATVRFQAEVDGSDLRDPTVVDILRDPAEGEYYSRLLDHLETKIRREQLGINVDGVQQGTRSRRFVHCEDTCLSMVQVLQRNSALELHATFRSCNVADVLPSDLRFLLHALDHVGSCLLDVPSDLARRLVVTINDGHIP